MTELYRQKRTYSRMYQQTFAKSRMQIQGVTSQNKCVNNGTIGATVFQGVTYENRDLRQSFHGQTGNRKSG